MSRGESHTDSSKRIMNKKLRTLATCSKERSFRAAQPPEANSRGRHLVSRAAFLEMPISSCPLLYGRLQAIPLNLVPWAIVFYFLFLFVFSLTF